MTFLIVVIKSWLNQRQSAKSRRNWKFRASKISFPYKMTIFRPDVGQTVANWPSQIVVQTFRHTLVQKLSVNQVSSSEHTWSTKSYFSRLKLCLTDRRGRIQPIPGYGWTCLSLLCHLVPITRFSPSDAYSLKHHKYVTLITDVKIFFLRLYTSLGENRVRGTRW